MQLWARKNNMGEEANYMKNANVVESESKYSVQLYLLPPCFAIGLQDEGYM